MTRAFICPVCERDDSIAAKDEPRFYRDGRLVAVCFHGHEGRGRVTFDAETGALLQVQELEPHELLYRAAEADGARGFGAQFLAEFCGVYVIPRKALQLVQPMVPTEKDWIRAETQDAALTCAPLYLGADMVGLEVRMIERKPGANVTKWTRILGQKGVYIARPALQPFAVVIFEGTWDAITAAWDAYEHGEPHRYAFLSITAGTSAQELRRTLDAHFPGVPALIVSDQDPAGKSARVRLASVATAAILPGTGLAKDYRAANPAKRWDALLEAIEVALEAPDPGAEHGLAKIARRALEGALRGKAAELRDLEAWRFGQRCAGICGLRSGKRYFAIRARLNGQMPVAEGQHEFSALLTHPTMKRVREDFPDLVAIIEGGPTESHVSTAWLPPQFLEDGRHWTEINPQDRTAFARDHAWEPWSGRDPGTPGPGDLKSFLEAIQAAYQFARIPGVPDSEVGLRVAVFAIATALSALWAEERWNAGLSVGFLPCTWFYGGPNSGKGTASKLIALLISGDIRTYGSQRFDGAPDTWLTESVLHHCVCFRDELDQFLPAASLEDLKTYTSGEPLQLRKKFGSDMTIAPKPVVISSNALKINEDDEATRDRINLVQLEPNLLSTKNDRNRAFDRFYAWVEAGGRKVAHRAGILLYRDFRATTWSSARWTRSASFDAAMAFVCERLAVDPNPIMAAANDGKEAAIRQSLPWFVASAEYVHHELGGDSGSYHEATAASVWGISLSDESQLRKLRRWIDQLEAALGKGQMSAGGWEISLGPRSASVTRRIIFRAVSSSVLEADLATR